MRKMMKRSVLASMCALCCAGIASTAMAQEAAKETPARASDTVELERVVATAQKRTESIMEVPMGISVISEEKLESLNAGRLTDYAAYVPGFQVDSGGAPGVTSMSLRGMAPLGGGAIIGTYIDDSPINPSSNKNRATGYALDLLPYDIQSVEILRGPQGTLYGASSMGGLFKYITRAADTENFEFRAGMDVSSVSDADELGTGVRAAANIPLTEGKLGMRVSFARQTTPGYIDEKILGKEDANGYDQLAARLAFTLNINENATLRVQGLWQTIDADSIAQVGLDPATQKPELGPLDGNAYLMQPYRNEVDFYSAILDWNLGFADLLSSTSYSATRMAITTDASPTYGVAWPLFGYPAGLANFDLYLGTRKWTQEFRLTSKTSERLDWLVGAYFTDEVNTNRQSVMAWDNDFNVLPFNPAVIALPGAYKEAAVFADATWKFSPKFDVSVGARYARNEQEFTQITTGLLVGEANTPGESAENVSTWKLASRWHLNDDSMLYARIATGYRPGGPNLALPGVPPMTKSDTTHNLELGFKSQFWDRRGMIDLALFKTSWDGIQVGAITGTGLTYITNAPGESKSQGVELSMLLRPLAGLTWGVNAAYIDSTISKGVPASSGLTPGGQMPLTPKRSWSTTLDYDFSVTDQWSGKVGGGYRYTGDRIGSFGGFPIDAYKAVDLHAELRNQNLSFRLYVRNATNEQEYMSIGVLRNALNGNIEQARGTPLVPRTIGMSVDYRF